MTCGQISPVTSMWQRVFISSCMYQSIVAALVLLFVQQPFVLHAVWHAERSTSTAFASFKLLGFRATHILLTSIFPAGTRKIHLCEDSVVSCFEYLMAKREHSHLRKARDSMACGSAKTSSSFGQSCYATTQVDEPSCLNPQAGGHPLCTVLPW